MKAAPANRSALLDMAAALSDPAPAARPARPARRAREARPARQSSQDPGTLPGAPWFHIDHYRTMTTWTPAQWFMALSNRFAALQSLQAIEANESGPGRDQWLASLQSHWSSVAADPVQPGGRYWRPAGRANPSFLLRLAGIDDGAGVDPGPIFPTSADEFAGFWKPQLGDRCALLVVDLAASDVDLKRAFEDWLRLTRQAAASASGDKPAVWKLSRETMRRWAHHRIVPFLDAEVFRLATGRTYTHAELSVALFGEPAYEDQLRKRTMQPARELMTEEFLQRFAASFGKVYAGRGG